MKLKAETLHFQQQFSPISTGLHSNVFLSKLVIFCPKFVKKKILDKIHSSPLPFVFIVRGASESVALQFVDDHFSVSLRFFDFRWIPSLFLPILTLPIK